MRQPGGTCRKFAAFCGWTEECDPHTCSVAIHSHQAWLGPYTPSNADERDEMKDLKSNSQPGLLIFLVVVWLRPYPPEGYLNIAPQDQSTNTMWDLGLYIGKD